MAVFGLNRQPGLGLEGILAALASLSIAWPLTTLLDGTSWWQPALAVVVVVALVGTASRTLGFLPGWTCLLQLLASVTTVMWLFLGPSLFYGLPTQETIPLAVSLLQDAGDVLRQYAAPAPTTQGVSFLVVLILGLTAVAVDSIGVTAQSPAAAGIPLAAAFLVSVSNNGQAMEPWFFLTTGGLWLLLIIQQHRRILGSWPSPGAGADHDGVKGRSAARSGVLSARVLGAGALLAAVVLAATMPHLPPTFLADGLATNSEANNVSGGTDGLSFIETMDPAEDLQNQSDAAVLTYTNDASAPAPLRVTSTSNFDDGIWQPPANDIDPDVAYDEIGAGPEDEEVQIVDVQVLQNALRAPHLAISTPLVTLDPDLDVAYNPDAGTVVVEQAIDSYSYSYAQVPDISELGTDVGQTAGIPVNYRDDQLFIPAEARPAVVEASSEVIGSETSALEQATLIQNYLRGSDFTYSLELLPEQPGVSDDPITQFLTNKQGYCVQFSTAMVMMARSQGIPARMAVGFLPGEQEPNGDRVVIASDAHTWPELYLEDLGWTRFEPTPGTRSGQAPSYAEDTSASPTETTAPETPTEAPTAPEATPTAQDTPQTDSSTASPWLTTLQRAAWALLGLAVIASLLLVVPLLSRRRIRTVRHQVLTGSSPMESAWRLLALQVRDLGVAVSPQRSPRSMRDFYAGLQAWPELASAPLQRLAGGLERERYASPGRSDYPAVQALADVDEVIGALYRSSEGSVRLKSRLFPVSGRTRSLL